MFLYKFKYFFHFNQISLGFREPASLCGFGGNDGESDGWDSERTALGRLSVTAQTCVSVFAELPLWGPQGHVGRWIPPRLYLHTEAAHAQGKHRR